MTQERECTTMSSSLQEIQQVHLELLLACREVCRRHNLPYYLAQGTLLGAVRHGGFIPWDDDADIIMPSDTLKEFVQYFQQEMGDHYFLESIHTEEHCLQTWVKIRKHGTTSMPRRYAKIPVHWGICIDIFPLYEVGDGAAAHFAAKMRFKIAKKLLAAGYTPCEEKPKLINRIVALVPLALRRSIAACCLRGLEKGKKGEEVFTLCRNSRFLKRAWFEGAEKTLPFEGEAFQVPSNPDAFLTEMFGDYMTPPPLEERCGHESKLGEIIWDTEKDYTAYL